MCVHASVYAMGHFFPEMVSHPFPLQHQGCPHFSRCVVRAMGREYSQRVGTDVMAKDMVKRCLAYLLGQLSDLPNGAQVLPSEPRKFLLRGFVDPWESKLSQNVKILEA